MLRVPSRLPPHTGLPRVLLSRPCLRWSVHIFQDVRATLTPNGYIFSEIRDINSKKDRLACLERWHKGGRAYRPCAAFLGERVVRLHSIKHAYMAQHSRLVKQAAPKSKRAHTLLDKERRTKTRYICCRCPTPYRAGRSAGANSRHQNSYEV